MPWRSVWNDRNSWHIREKLNIRLMRKAAKFITGRHDFSAFDASGSTQENKTACISSIKITRREGKLSLAFTGDRFLYKMVRNIVGTLVGAGRGEFPPEKLAEILEGGDRTKAGRTAPSKGLFLEKIQFYEKQKRKA
jgi:tRNA pseudouridine38-40 synthase